jgi:D-alanyl-D-alanine carboxypeptidase
MFIQKTNKHAMLPIVLFFISIIAILLANGLYFYDKNVYLNDKIATIDRQLEVESAKFAIIFKRMQPVPITLPGAKPINALVDDYDSNSSIWKLVSKTSPISIEYSPSDLIIPLVATRTDKSDSERSVRADINKALVDMFAAAATDGSELMIGSGYRSGSLQKLYFDNLARSVGDETANQSIAYPGQSEHQTGLAVDISTVSRECYINNCFATTGGGIWLTDNSYKYGFTLRYPEGKEPVTGYRYEPWHFRYVGVNLATALHESGLTLDEAWPYLQAALVTLKENGAI